MSGLLDYIHEFHPYDILFVVPIIISAWLFLKHHRSKLTFFETLFGSVVASTFITLVIMAFILGPWPLIGVTAGLILGLYLPVCLMVGLLAIAAAKTSFRKSNA